MAIVFRGISSTSAASSCRFFPHVSVSFTFCSRPVLSVQIEKSCCQSWWALVRFAGLSGNDRARRLVTREEDDSATIFIESWEYPDEPSGIVMVASKSNQNAALTHTSLLWTGSYFWLY